VYCLAIDKQPQRRHGHKISNTKISQKKGQTTDMWAFWLGGEIKENDSG